MDLLDDERLEDSARVGIDAGRQILRSRLGTLKRLHVRASLGGGKHVEGQPQLSADAPRQPVCLMTSRNRDLLQQ